MTINVDTVKIIEEYSNFGFGTYNKIWTSSAVGYRLQEASHQDSLILEFDSLSTYYYKVFDSKNRIMLEGLKIPIDNYLIKDVIHYRKSGELKKVEHWKSEAFSEFNGGYYYRSDSPTWDNRKKYDKKGNLKTEVFFQLDEKNPSKCKFKKVVKRF